MTIVIRNNHKKVTGGLLNIEMLQQELDIYNG
jgi:hypothetical protein